MESQQIIDEICDYIETKHIKETFQEYLKRIVVQTPADPIQFLIETIESEPFVFGAKPEEEEQVE